MLSGEGPGWAFLDPSTMPPTEEPSTEDWASLSVRELSTDGTGAASVSAGIPEASVLEVDGIPDGNTNIISNYK